MTAARRLPTLGLALLVTVCTMLALITAPAARAATVTAAPSTLQSPSYWGTAPQIAAEEVVVKLDTSDPAAITELASRYHAAVTSAVLASRGIYLVHSTRCDCYRDRYAAQQLAGQLKGDPEVVYAEPDSTVDLEDTGFSEWAYGSTAPSNWYAYRTQPAVGQLMLNQVHAQSLGRGVTVAVLDTGVDPSQPAVAGRLVSGWNYVGDDADTDDVPDAGGSAAVGHGTFVAGLVALAAPGARIMPERVLDGSGNGNVFVVAQAVLDAVAAGADVINMSFGTEHQLRSPVLIDAIDQATAAGVLVVAAAGNDGNNAPHYPAAYPDVLSVAASDTAGHSLAAFSDFGGWIDVAAPGQQIVGPVPGGGFATWSGTSMAAPFVAGEAALLLAAAPGLSVPQLTSAIESVGRPLTGNTVTFGEVDPAGAMRALNAAR